MIREISVEELKARRDRGENPLVLDVREDWELQLARIPDVVHVPMNQVPARLGSFRAMRRPSSCAMRAEDPCGWRNFCRTKDLRTLPTSPAAFLPGVEAVDATVPQY